MIQRHRCAVTCSVQENRADSAGVGMFMRMESGADPCPRNMDSSLIPEASRVSLAEECPPLPSAGLSSISPTALKCLPLSRPRVPCFALWKVEQCALFSFTADTSNTTPYATQVATKKRTWTVATGGLSGKICKSQGGIVQKRHRVSYRVKAKWRDFFFVHQQHLPLTLR